MFAALTHDRVPDTGPLPDLVLDAVRYQGWGLAGCEYLLLLTTGLAMLVVALHSHCQPPVHLSVPVRPTSTTETLQRHVG